MAEPILEVRGLSRQYGSTKVVNDVAFDLHRGETLTLLGPSGCGKSTTLRMIAGLERPDAGEIRINGTRVVDADRGLYVPPEKRNVGLVFQSYAVWPHMTVAENVAYPLQVRKIPEREQRDRVGRILELTDLADYARRPATQLSGGQQQRVALARALVYEPALLLLDEPLSNLDAQLRHEMRIQLKRLQTALGTTMLFVTHDQMEAMALAHRIAIMRAGVIEQIGDPRAIYHEPASHFVHSFLGRCITLPGRKIAENGAGLIDINGCGVIDVGRVIPDDGAADVRVSVRPENIQISLDPPPISKNVLQATVEDVVFLGDRYECALAVGDTHRFVLEGPPSLKVAPGQSVVLRVDAAAARVWPS